MELSAYLIPLRRWWWLLLASTLVAVVSSFIATINQPPVYQASTTLMIGRVIDDPNPNQGEIYLAQQLAQTYAEIANREPVRNATMQALGLTRLPEYLARALPQTQFIEIAVTDVNPLRAQVVANELANQL
ncbi:MAG: Wzz/FepE/Etk N-terminal domain-containing protein, partial [Anaerolineales bacterium]